MSCMSKELGATVDPWSTFVNVTSRMLFMSGSNDFIAFVFTWSNGLCCASWPVCLHKHEVQYCAPGCIVGILKFPLLQLVMYYDVPV